MGLFFGASVITVAELAIYISKMCWIIISRKRREYMARKKKNELEREQRLRELLENAAANTTTPNTRETPLYESVMLRLRDDTDKKSVHIIDGCCEPSIDSDEDSIDDSKMRRSALCSHNITTRDRATSSSNYVDPHSFDLYYFNDDEIVAHKNGDPSYENWQIKDH